MIVSRLSSPGYISFNPTSFFSGSRIPKDTEARFVSDFTVRAVFPASTSVFRSEHRKHLFVCLFTNDRFRVVRRETKVRHYSRVQSVSKYAAMIFQDYSTFYFTIEHLFIRRNLFKIKSKKYRHSSTSCRIHSKEENNRIKEKIDL